MDAGGGSRNRERYRTAHPRSQNHRSKIAQTCSLGLEKGAAVDLRPHLASGRLDVVIQDDTVVHEARLRILRGQ